MASNFNVNIQISAGNSFAQEFYLANPDKSPMDITGCSVSAYIAKHPGAIIARETEYAGTTGSDVNNIVYSYIEFGSRVVDGQGGVYELSLSPEATKDVPQGKYFYSVSLTDTNGVKNQVLSGLAFIDFGSVI